MDTLVARYTRSPFESEGFSSDEQQDSTDSLPPLSLKFALPPVARVSHLRQSVGWSPNAMLIFYPHSLPRSSVPQQTTMPTPTAPSSSRMEQRLSPFVSRVGSLLPQILEPQPEIG